MDLSTLHEIAAADTARCEVARGDATHADRCGLEMHDAAALAERVVRQECGVPVRAILFHGSCMLIAPTHGDGFAALVGRQGERIARLREMLGLQRLFVARKPQAMDPFGRLKCAVARVTGLRRRAYTVRMSPRPACVGGRPRRDAAAGGSRRPEPVLHPPAVRRALRASAARQWRSGMMLFDPALSVEPLAAVINGARS
jgi:hypothetical protein